MSSDSPVVTLRWLLGEDLLLARLILASLELAGLALLVALLVRLGRIRSARVVSLLWLVVLVKPLVSLAVGSPLPIFLLEAGEARFAETADTPAVVVVPPDGPRFAWAASSDPDDPLGGRLRFEPPDTPARASLRPVAASEPLPADSLLEGTLPRAITVAWLMGVGIFFGRTCGPGRGCGGSFALPRRRRQACTHGTGRLRWNWGCGAFRGSW